ncbi:YkoF-like protein [Kalaharituber pfeilii]|nr:YkoF-like protein [Kalaharituber pfeilii]
MPPVSVPPLESLSTPPKCSVDVSLLPIGTGTPSVAQEIAQIQRLLAQSGLVYTMHSAGTTIDGSWDEVMTIIGKFHTLIHDMGVVRIQSDIRVGTRTDKNQPHTEKVAAVERILQGDAKKAE